MVRWARSLSPHPMVQLRQMGEAYDIRYNGDVVCGERRNGLTGQMGNSSRLNTTCEPDVPQVSQVFPPGLRTNSLFQAYPKEHKT